MGSLIDQVCVFCTDGSPHEICAFCILYSEKCTPKYKYCSKCDEHIEKGQKVELPLVKGKKPRDAFICSLCYKNILDNMYLKN